MYYLYFFLKRNNIRMFANGPRFAISANIFFHKRFPVYGTYLTHASNHGEFPPPHLQPRALRL